MQERAMRHIRRMDIVVKATEIKWGLMWHIETLVPDDLAAKFQRQWKALTDAITACDHESVVDLADGVIRGIWAMEKAAISAGHIPAPLTPIGSGVEIIAMQDPSEGTALPMLPKEFWDNGGDFINF